MGGKIGMANSGKPPLSKRLGLLGVAASLMAILGFSVTHSLRALEGTSRLSIFPNPTGYLGTFSTTGSIEPQNPFLQSLGTNGRTCKTCHMPNDAWSVTPQDIQERFLATNGTDPIFRPVDGSVCPNAPGVNNLPPSHTAYSLLLSKGLIRISIAIPSNAQFTVKVISDPYGCAITTDSTGQEYLSMYRRPLPATNLGFLSTVMFDGRETIDPLNNPSTYQSNLTFDLEHQAMDAALTHAQAVASPPQEQLQQIVSFETSTYTAQQFDFAAGDLGAAGASGGPTLLSMTPYYPGINDPLGGNPTGAAFNPDAFSIFTPWQNLMTRDERSLARESIARGEVLFNTAPVTIQDVKGLNDTLGITTIMGTCTTCHDTPNVGDHSLPLPLDIGISDVPANSSDPVAPALAELNPPRTPVFQLTCTTQLGAPSNLVVETTDPGRAMITGHCADIGKFKGPVLRGLAGRAPYFQNGSADSLDQVVRFYNQRFSMGLTESDMADLAAFLRTL